MIKRRTSFCRKSSSLFFLILLVVICAGCEADHKALIEKTLDAREDAMNEKNLDAYLALISKDYQYSPDSKMTIKLYMEENLLCWDIVHIKTYNRLIYIEGGYASVNQDYQMSLTAKGETKLFSGAEHFLMKKEGIFSPEWKFVKGLGGG